MNITAQAQIYQARMKLAGRDVSPQRENHLLIRPQGRRKNETVNQWVEELLEAASQDINELLRSGDAPVEANHRDGGWLSGMWTAFGNATQRLRRRLNRATATRAVHSRP